MRLSSSISKVLSGKAFKLNAGQERRQLLQIFWVVVWALLLVAVQTIDERPAEVSLGAALIFVASLLPVYLWCKGKAHGLPIYPVFSLTHIWTCAIPLYTEHQAVSRFTPEEQFVGCLTVVGFLVVGTMIWYKLTSTPVRRGRAYIALEGSSAQNFFLGTFIASVVFTVAAIGGWFYFLSFGAFSVVRGFVLGLNALATFVLAYQWGRRELGRKMVALFSLSLLGYMAATAASLMIVGALSTFVLAAIGFTIGRRQLPVVVMALVLVCLVVLHYGKAPMRAKYTAEDGSNQVQPWDYPTWFAEWVGYSIDELTSDKKETEEGNSFLNRVSTIHLLLMAQQRTAEGVPLLYGETYVIIPRMLIPRVFDPDKPIAHEGNSLLNIHYGLQTRENTNTTTIGWGLLNEAYANFGLLGVGGLAVVLGWFYGQATRWSMDTPLLSARSLFTMLLLNFSLQSEFAASVYVTALFQSTVSLAFVAFLFMRSQYFDRDSAQASI